MIKQAHINRQTKPDMGTENLLHSFATDRKLGTAAGFFFFLLPHLARICRSTVSTYNEMAATAQECEQA